MRKLIAVRGMLHLLLVVLLAWASTTCRKTAAAEPRGAEKTPEIVVQTGHSGWVCYALFSPDGKQVATISDRGILILWDARTGQALQTLENGHIRIVRFSPDGTQIATYSDRPGQVILFDAFSGATLHTLDWSTRGYNLPCSITFSPDSKRMVVGVGHEAIVWDATTGKRLRSIPGSVDVDSFVACSADARQVAMRSADHITIWDSETGEKRCDIKWNDPQQDRSQFSPDGKLFVTRHADSRGETNAHFWGTRTGELLRRGDWPVAFSPDGSEIVTPKVQLPLGTDVAADILAAVVGDSKTGKQILSLNLDRPNFFQVSYSSDGRQLLVGQAYWLWMGTPPERTSILWDANTGHKIHTFTGYPLDSSRLSRFASDVFSPDGRQVVLSSPTGGAALWDTRTSEKTQTLQRRSDKIDGLAFSPDQKHFASASANGPVVVWSRKSGRPVRVIAPPDVPANANAPSPMCVRFSPDGKQVKTIPLGMNPATILSWDIETGKQVEAVAFNVSLTPEAVSPDETLTVQRSWSNNDHSAHVFDAQTGKETRELTGHTQSVTCATFSPNGRLIAAGSGDGTVIFWEASTGEMTQTFELDESRVRSLAFGPDGKRMVTGSRSLPSMNGIPVPTFGEDTAVVWNAETGEKLCTLWGDRDPIYEVAIGPGGKRVLTHSLIDGESTDILWNAESSKRIRKLPAHIAAMENMAFSQDGRFLLVGCDDGVLHLLDAESGAQLCALLTFDHGKDWLVYTPDGYFDGSEGARQKYVRFRDPADPMRLLRVEQGYQAYYRPNLLADIFAGRRVGSPPAQPTPKK